MLKSFTVNKLDKNKNQNADNEIKKVTGFNTIEEASEKINKYFFNQKEKNLILICKDYILYYIKCKKFDKRKKIKYTLGKINESIKKKKKKYFFWINFCNNLI